MNRNIRQRRAWSDLPPELLSLIADRHNSRSVFRAVCKSWRSSTPPPPQRLHPYLPRQVIFNNHGNDVFVPSKTGFLVVCTMVFILRHRCNPSVKPWLVAIEQSRLGKLRLYHPLTNLPIRNFPRNMPNFSVTMLNHGFNIRCKDGITPALLQPQDKAKSHFVNKVVLLPHHPSFYYAYYVIVLYGIGNLVFFRLPNVYREWEMIKVAQGLIDDIIVWTGLVWAVNRKGRLLAYDFEPVRTKVCVAHCYMGGFRRNRLVLDCNNELFLVVVNNKLSCDQFDVYKLNEKYDWVKVASLGDMILFVSHDACFFVSSLEFPGIQGNCIVFSKNCFAWYNGGSKYSDDALFRNEANEYLQVGVSKYGEGKNFKLISEFPEFCDAFWPPPQWIWNSHDKQDIISCSLCYKNPLMNGQYQRVADASCTINHHENTNAGIAVALPPRTNTANIQNMCSILVPILLNRLWARYGYTNCNHETRAIVCKSLGKVICIILRMVKTRMTTNLTETQAQHLVSTLGDLQFALEVRSLFDPCSFEGL